MFAAASGAAKRVREAAKASFGGDPVPRKWLTLRHPRSVHKHPHHNTTSGYVSNGLLAVIAPVMQHAVKCR